MTDATTVRELREKLAVFPDTEEVVFLVPVWDARQEGEVYLQARQIGIVTCPEGPAVRILLDSRVALIERFK